MDNLQPIELSTGCTVCYRLFDVHELWIIMELALVIELFLLPQVTLTHSLGSNFNETH